MSRLVKIALFVIVTGTGSMFYVMETAETINAPDTYEVKAIIDDASGLLPGTGVRVAGVNVGRVREVELVGGRAQLLMEISTEVRLHHDAVVQRTMQSMLGNSIVTLIPGTEAAPPIENGGVIQNVSSKTTMDKMFLSGEKAAAEMGVFMEDFNTFLNEGGYRSMQEILDLTRETVATTNLLVERNLLLLSESLERINSITARLDERSGEDIRELSELISHTAGIARQIDILLQEEGGDIADSIDAMRTSIDQLNRSLANIESITRKIDEGEGNIGRLVQDEELYTRIDRVTKNVDEFIASAVGMDVQVGFSSEYLAFQNSLKNHAEVRFVPRSAPKFYSLGLTAGPSYDTTETITHTVVTGTTTSDTTTTETIMTNDVKLSAQLARSFGPLTLRGGVIENRAGLGLKLQPIDQISVTAEVFDFGQDQAPYVRGYGTFFPVFDPQSSNFFNWLYISGGVDNAFHSEDRDFFIGLGLRLTDNDLRSILPFVPTGQ